MIIIISEISPLLGSKGDAAIYIFNRDRLISNYEAISVAFTAKYANFKIAYSFKTNYLKEIITTVHGLGGWAEVVSPYELWYAQALKFAPTAIVYNGVIPDWECKYHIAANGIVNIDSYEGFAALRERAKERHELIRIGLRVSFESETVCPPDSGLILTVRSSRRLCRRFGIAGMWSWVDFIAT